jgi:uncharacterized protein (TIGR02145 family)
MKKLYALLALIVTTVIFAQAPQGFNYQATVRNSAGALIVNQNVNFKFNIMLNSATSLPIFSETHLAPTDDLGQVNLIIGSGTATTGNFSTINWGTGNYYLGIELNTGSGYVAMGTTQLLSVPYALYANSSGNAQTPTPNLASVLAVNNSANNTKITNLANPTLIQDAVNKQYSDGGDSALQAQIDQLQSQIEALHNFNMIQTTTSIGTQIWSSINLNVATYRDGTPIPQVSDPSQWANLTTGAWCYYNNNSADGNIYGKMYNWYAVAGIHDNDPNTPNKILAPLGWHIATDAEFTTLTTFLGGMTVAGGKMKSTGTTYWQSPNAGATNESGFSAMPGGLRNANGTFGAQTIDGYWWSASEDNSTNAWYRIVVNGNAGVGRSSTTKNLGFSVRCIRD